MKRLTRRDLARLASGSVAAAAFAQQPTVSQLLEQARKAEAAAIADGTVWICPMDPDVRSHNPGTCARCGMALKAGLPDSAEYPLDVAFTPSRLVPGQPATARLAIHDPWKGRPVTNFQLVHEKLFHLFVVSRDLNHFVHDHPELQPDSTFTIPLTFPRPGLYRLLGDFYPDGGTPQLAAKTVYVPGSHPMPAVTPPPDYAAKDSANLHIEIATVPAKPIAGMTTQIHFRLSPSEDIQNERTGRPEANAEGQPVVRGLERYLGAWGHMLAASDDLIDLIHTHPFIADGGPAIQFNVTFPRAHTYRVWVQFQSAGQVNTAHYDIPVSELR